MNIQVYAGGILAYDNLIPVEKGYTLQSILVKEQKNTGGTATLLLPPNHPLRDGFSAFKTSVEIYRNGVLRWRGRALPENRDFYCRGKITCEGELCFFQDSTLRPGVYSGTLLAVFSGIINAHNARVEEWKRFKVGNVTVATDETVEITLKAGKKTYAAIMELVNTYGGIILFDSAPDGSRRINWYAEMPYSCNQRISLGTNLTDYSSSVDMTGFATRIIPYGAEDADGNPITINIDGKDYVESSDGVAQRGIIEMAISYPGIIDPEELRAAAQRDVDKAATLPETVKLSALDISRQNMGLDAFCIGQRVNAESAPHKLSGFYDLVAIEEELINPGAGSITLTKDAAYYSGVNSTLTGSVSSQDEELQEKAKDAAKEAVDAQTQEDIFNRLTNNGASQGLYVLNGELYINASYLVSGILRSKDGETFYLDLDSGVLKMKATEFTVSGKTVDDIAKDKAWDAAKNAVDAQTQEDIFNKLTNNGASQGLYILDGLLCINATYIKSGKIVSEGMAYLPPTYDDCLDMLWSQVFPDKYPPEDFYDINGDGVFDVEDVRLANRVYLGNARMSDCAGAVATAVTVTIDPFNAEETVMLSGTNAWGKLVSMSLGVTRSKIPHIDGDCTVSGRFSVGGHLVTPSLALTINETPKTLSWKDNGDGTFTPIGQ